MPRLLRAGDKNKIKMADGHNTENSFQIKLYVDDFIALLTRITKQNHTHLYSLLKAE